MASVENVTTPEPEGSQDRRRRVRATISKVKERSKEARRRAEAARPRSAAIDTGFRMADRDRLVGGGVLAGALAYRLFLWLLPFALVLVGLLGLLGRMKADAAEEVAVTAGIGAYVAGLIAESTSSSSWTALLVGAFALYFASAGAYKTMRVVHFFAWQLPVTPAKRSPKATLGFFVAATAFVVMTALVNRARGIVPGPDILLTFVLVPLYAAAWVLVSRHLPHPGVPWTALVPGAITIAVGAQLIHLVALLYIAPRLERSSEVYGTLGGAAVLLLWIFIIGRMVVLAAEVNAVSWQRRLERANAASDREPEPAEITSRAG